MRLTEYLTEAAGQYGIVVTTQKNGKFEDVVLYDIAANNIAKGGGHVQNLFDGLVSVLRDNAAWDKIGPFLKEKSTSSKLLGEEYGDSENFDNVLYGPFDMNQIGQISDEIESMHSNDDQPLVDRENR